MAIARRTLGYSKIWFICETQLKSKPMKSGLTHAYSYISFTRSLWNVDICCFGITGKSIKMVTGFVSELRPYLASLLVLSRIFRGNDAKLTVLHISKCVLADNITASKAPYSLLSMIHTVFLRGGIIILCLADIQFRCCVTVQKIQWPFDRTTRKFDWLSFKYTGGLWAGLFKDFDGIS